MSWFNFGKKKDVTSNNIEFRLDSEKIKDILEQENIDPDTATSLIETIRNSVDTSVQEKRELDYDDFVTNIVEQISTLYTKPTDRIQQCKMVDEFASENPEAFNSIRLYASYICYGSVEMKMDEYKVTVVHDDNELVNKAYGIIEDFNRKSKIRRLIYIICSEMIKYGDAFLEKVKDNGGSISSVAYLPSKDMVIFLDDTGAPLNFFQICSDQSNIKTDFVSLTKYIKADGTASKVIQFEPDEILHFNDGTLPGLSDSPMLSLAAIWKSLKLIEESLIIHRVTRARRIIVFMLDVTGKTKEQAKRALRGFTEKLTSVFRINTSEGIRYKNKSVVKQGTDIVIPVTKDTATKIQTIPNDASATKIDDIQFYHKRIMNNLLTAHIFSDTKTGKEEYLERALIRLVRTYQRMASFTLEDLYTQVIEEAGIKNARISVQFPSPDLNEEIKLVDTIIRRMMVINQLIATLGVVPPTEWIVKYVFKDLSQPEIQELISLIQYEKKKSENQASGSEFPTLIEDESSESSVQQTEPEIQSIDNNIRGMQSNESTHSKQHILLDMLNIHNNDGSIDESMLFESRRNTNNKNVNIPRDPIQFLDISNKTIETTLKYLETKSNSSSSLHKLLKDI